MGKSDRLVAYAIGILALTAILLSWISHSHSSRTGPKPEPPTPVGAPWTQSSPSRAAVPSTSQDSPSQGTVLTTPEDARPAYQPPQHQADAPAADPSRPPDFSSSSQEAPAPPDSDQNPSKGESASQRVARRLRRH